MVVCPFCVRLVASFDRIRPSSLRLRNRSPNAYKSSIGKASKGSRPRKLSRISGRSAIYQVLLCTSKSLSYPRFARPFVIGKIDLSRRGLSNCAASLVLISFSAVLMPRKRRDMSSSLVELVIKVAVATIGAIGSPLGDAKHRKRYEYWDTQTRY